MSETLNPIRPGEVEIELVGWGRPLVLRPTLKAAMALSKRYDGLQMLIQRMGVMDFEAYVQVIAAGADVLPKGMEKLRECVFATGTIDLLPDLTRYCCILANGGRPVGETKPDDKPEDGDPSPE